jgi:hypothetical protein
MTVFAAICEMHSASVVCKEELLYDVKQGDEHTSARAASADSVLRRVMKHVAAAGITSGRSAEVYGLVFPVRHPQITFPFLYAIHHFRTLFRSTSHLTSLSLQQT